MVLKGKKDHFVAPCHRLFGRWPEADIMRCINFNNVVQVSTPPRSRFLIINYVKFFTNTGHFLSQAMHCCRFNYLVQCPPQEAGLHAGAWGEGGGGGGGRREGEGEGGGEGDEWRPSLTPQHHMSVTSPLWKPPKARSIIVWIYQTITGCLCTDVPMTGWADVTCGG